MARIQISLFYWVVLFIAPSFALLNWLDKRVSNVKSWSIETCNDPYLPLTKRQRRYCTKKLPYMSFLSNSIDGIKHDCRQAFLNEQWNCDGIMNNPNNFDKSFTTATREAAATNAIAGGYLLRLIINGCQSKGLCPKCKTRMEQVPKQVPRAIGEENLKEIAHESGACDDMFPSSIDFVTRFIKIGKKRMDEWKTKSPKTLGLEKIKMHNQRAGMEIQRENRSPRCYCFGLFRGCFTKVCNTAMDFFWKSHKQYVNAYNKARKVFITRTGSLVPADEPDRPIGRKEFIYTKDFNVCATKTGTSNRGCSIDEAMKKRLKYKLCDKFCCNGKYHKIPSRFRWKCNCKYNWRNTIKLGCEMCVRYEDGYSCLE